eukprot:9955016-Heterocapsa_arctica.AAC.1
MGAEPPSPPAQDALYGGEVHHQRWPPGRRAHGAKLQGSVERVVPAPHHGAAGLRRGLAGQPAQLLQEARDVRRPLRAQHLGATLSGRCSMPTRAHGTAASDHGTPSRHPAEPRGLRPRQAMEFGMGGGR